MTVFGRTFRVADLVVAATAVLGLLLALPSIASPTSRLVLSDPGRGSVLSDQRWWSWGQVSTTNVGSYERIIADAPGLCFFVTALVVGVVAVLYWVLRSTPDGCLLGVVGVSVPTVYLAAVVVQRLGLERKQAYDLTGLVVESKLQPAAVSEVAATVVLALSLLAMALLTLRSPDRLGRVAERLETGHEAAIDPGREGGTMPSAEPAQAFGAAADGTRKARDGTTPAPGGSRLTGPDTGFCDEPTDRPHRRHRPDHRFEPPT